MCGYNIWLEFGLKHGLYCAADNWLSLLAFQSEAGCKYCFLGGESCIKEVKNAFTQTKKSEGK